MAVDLGVHAKQKATVAPVPIVASCGIPYVVGAAPISLATDPAPVNTPTLVESWSEVLEKFGYSDDWKTYPLCSFFYSHFQLYAMKPAIICNVYGGSEEKAQFNETYTVENHTALLPVNTDADTLTVTADDTELTADTDYIIVKGEDAVTLELLESGSAYSAASVTVSGYTVTYADVTEADIADGISQVDACLTLTGEVPDLILAPGWSGTDSIATLMAEKAGSINGLFTAKALIDIPCGEDGVTSYKDLADYKTLHQLTSVNQILCWPQLYTADKQYPFSAQLAGLMAYVDNSLNDGTPHESPSNKTLKCAGACLEDGTEVNLTWNQINTVAGEYGVVTAMYFPGMDWVAKGNYTACYPTNTDVKDYFIPVSRMFGWVGNTVVRTFWSKLDKPMTKVLVASVQDACNIWLNGLVSKGALLGARIEMRDDENPVTDLCAGIFRLHIYMTPPSPAQEIEFTTEYDLSYVTAAFSS